MLYREKADNILHDKANKNKVILVYSKYIPCSQNQNSNGGTFLECAGELANFMANINPNGNKLIVFYETKHEAINNYDGVKVSSVLGVSQLYMEMSGIVAFKYMPGNNNNGGYLIRDPLLVDMATYFRENPMFLHLGRPLMNKGYKATVTQLFIDCLARNDFVKLPTNLIENHEVRFIAVKSFLSEFSHAKKKKLEDLVTAANEGKNPTDQHRAIVKGCHVFAKKMLEDDIKKHYIKTEQKQTDYLSFDGTAAKTTEFPYQDEKDTCRAYLKALNHHFNKKTSEKNVCFNGDDYERNKENIMRGKNSYHDEL
ncbi:hypothetical protein EB796_007869 [Bugula neritina]|uniref:Uncharacterized protein n=1 Tax=Bugula neritina TaxID=10212 RepID=A0A7J7K5B9_BUGNE|nr:hypothetical protein EB796_007869 [Bugula neritina]